MSVVNDSQAVGTKDGTGEFEPTILAFACHWCTYSGADLAGLNRMNYPANVRLLRVPCSGRVNPQYVISAFNKGCDGVLVCGCHPGDCHYVSGNYFAKRRLMAFKRLLEYSGMEPGRFQVRWISGSEAGKFRDTVIQVCADIKNLGPLQDREADALASISVADLQKGAEAAGASASSESAVAQAATANGNAEKAGE